MANVSTGPSSAASQSETAGPDSTSRTPPTTASATQPMSGSGPVSSATAAAKAGAEPRKWADANSTANDGARSPSDARAWPAARRPASSGSAESTRAPPAFTTPGYADHPESSMRGTTAGYLRPCPAALLPGKYFPARHSDAFEYNRYECRFSGRRDAAMPQDTGRPPEAGITDAAGRRGWPAGDRPAGTGQDPPSGPLAGVRVLDLTSVVMGPLATQILGDLGADVITVENRGGDINRIMSPGPRRGLSGISLNLLRNKRNIVLDAGHPEGRSALLRIAAGCDVFVSNLRPGSLNRLRLGYPDVAAARPDVIYCQAQGFPSDSPQADAPAFDDIIQAASGVPDVLRRAGGTSGLVPTLLADKVCGLVLTYSIIAALFHRERTGEGQHVEVPMTDAMRAFLLVEHGSAAISRPPSGPAGYQRILTPLRGALRTADGWIAVQPHGDAQWGALLRAAGLDDLVGDPRLSRRGIWLDPGFGYATLGRVLAAR